MNQPNAISSRDLINNIVPIVNDIVLYHQKGVKRVDLMLSVLILQFKEKGKGNFCK